MSSSQASSMPTPNAMADAAQQQRGIGVIGFLAALSVAVGVFVAQIIIFLRLRNDERMKQILLACSPPFFSGSF